MLVLEEAEDFKKFSFYPSKSRQLSMVQQYRELSVVTHSSAQVPTVSSEYHQIEIEISVLC
jgi:hypothetical protein